MSINKIPKAKVMLTTASLLSLSISTALYAAQPAGVQNTDHPLSAAASSPLAKRFIIKYKQNGNAQYANTQSDGQVSPRNL